MAEMWSHLGRFVGTVLGVFLSIIGTTPIGWLLPIALTIAAAIPTLQNPFRKGGVHGLAVKFKHRYKLGLKYSLWAAVALNGPIVLWSIGQAVYEDHQALIARSQSQRSVIAQDSTRILQTKSTGEQEYQKLQMDCSKTAGERETLQTQNRDQQNTINNCQYQAIRLLATPLKVTPVLIEGGHISPLKMQGNFVSKYVLITNHDLSPVHIRVECPNLFGALAFMPTAGHWDVNSHMESQHVWTDDIREPAMTQENPVILEVLRSTPADDCRIAVS